MRVTSFNNLLTKENIDKLEREKGCCILYTHFAYDFVDENGNLDEGFKAAIDYLASKNAWFATASEILDHVLRDREYKPSKFYEFMMDIKWFFERLKKCVYRQLRDKSFYPSDPAVFLLQSVRVQRISESVDTSVHDFTRFFRDGESDTRSGNSRINQLLPASNL